MINHFTYQAQLRQYLLQFVSIFYGLQVKTGKGECDEEQYITVPVVVANKDRVVAAIMAGNTQNKMFSLPAMAAYLQGLSLAPERRRNPGLMDQRVTMKTGGVFPEDLTVVKRAMPIPYNAQIELSIYASNTQQMHQILEQILVLFNPDLQIQKSDGEFDWTRITKVELTDIANEENYPSATDRRMIVWTLSFEVPIYLSIPMGVKDDLVRKVIIQIASLGSMVVNEVDADGHLTPFGDPLAKIVVDTTTNPPTMSVGSDSNANGTVDPIEMHSIPTTIEKIKPPEGPVPFPPEPLP
jgi:hypothetical protein